MVLSRHKFFWPIMLVLPHLHDVFTFPQSSRAVNAFNCLCFSLASSVNLRVSSNMALFFGFISCTESRRKVSSKDPAKQEHSLQRLGPRILLHRNVPVQTGTIGRLIDLQVAGFCYLNESPQAGCQRVSCTLPGRRSRSRFSGSVPPQNGQRESLCGISSENAVLDRLRGSL